MKGNKVIWTGLGILSAISILASGAMAYWNSTGQTLNILSMASYRTELVEEYVQPDVVYPGTSVDKTVSVENTGSVDTLVRVKVTRAFGTKNPDGVFIKDSALDPEMIQIPYNTKYWKQVDEYWYYKDVLKSGQKTKEPLFHEFTVSEKAGNEYRGKEAEIVVSMESIQAQGDADTLWGVTKKQLGIEYESAEKEQDTFVTFTGESGFVFEGLGTDLFSNFKNLLPGCARTQRIHIANSSATPVNLYLHAEATDQDTLNEKEQILVKELLQKHAQIEIRSGSDILYTGPVDGNPLGRTGENSMGEFKKIPLGSYASGTGNDLIVILQLSPEMDNEFLSLTGKVRWVFTAQGEDTVTATVPKTGDPTDLLPSLISLSVSGMILAFILFGKQSKKKRDSGRWSK